MQKLIGDDIDEVKNGSLLNYMRPFDRGYLNNWQAEIEVKYKSFPMSSVQLQIRIYTYLFYFS